MGVVHWCDIKLVTTGPKEDVDYDTGWRVTTEHNLETPMPAPKSNLTCVTRRFNGHAQFWVSDPEPIDEGGGDWGFAIYSDKDVFLATFTYPSQHAASLAREAVMPVLRETTFIATAES
jgi:hypothetical protein